MLKFNSTGEILAVLSRWKTNGIKLIHMGSMTVFQNWPDFKSHIQFPFSINFSEESKYFYVGNDEGNVLMYKLNFYS